MKRAVIAGFALLALMGVGCSGSPASEPFVAPPKTAPPEPPPNIPLPTPVQPGGSGN